MSIKNVSFPDYGLTRAFAAYLQHLTLFYSDLDLIEVLHYHCLKMKSSGLAKIASPLISFHKLFT